MAYVPTDWVDGTTPVNATNLDHLEQGVAAAHAGLPPSPTGQDGRWLTVAGGAMAWQSLPASISPTLIDAAGDLIVGSANDTAARLPAPTTTGDVLTADLTQALKAKWATPTGGGSAPTFGANPPASPVDGQEWILPVATGVLWRFRYRAASAPYPWEFVGGAAAYFAITAATTTIGTVFGDYGGPAITVARAGEYVATFGCRMLPSTGVFLGMGLQAGATAPTDVESAWASGQAASGVYWTTPSRQAGFTLTAGAEVRAMYKRIGGTATGNTADGRYLSLLPMRVA